LLDHLREPLVQICRVCQNVLGLAETALLLDGGLLARPVNHAVSTRLLDLHPLAGHGECLAKHEAAEFRKELRVGAPVVAGIEVVNVVETHLALEGPRLVWTHCQLTAPNGGEVS